QERACHAKALGLPAGELAPVFPDHRVPAFGQRMHPLPEARLTEHVLELIVARVRTRQENVLANARGEEVGILPRGGDGAATVLLAILAQIAARQRDPATVGV